MPRDLDIGLLRAFVAVAETGGMTSAGRLVNLTQAAVSQQIKRLEDLLQVSLFDRDSRALRATEAGERLLTHARRLIDMNDEVVSLMTAPQFEGEATLGIPHDLVSAFLPSILNSFRQQRPGIRVSVVSSTTEKLLRMMGEGQVSMTMTTEPTPAPGRDMLLQQPLVWVGAQGGQSFKRRPLPLSLGDDTCAFRKVSLSALRSHGIDWVQSCRAAGMGPMVATVEADVGISTMLAATVPPQVEILRVGSHCGLPQLQDFFINLRLPVAGVTDVAMALADHIRDHFALRFRHAA